MQVLDFQTQQFCLFPQMANAYAIKFASKAIMAYYHNVAVHINKGNLEELPIVSIAQTDEKNVSLKVPKIEHI